MHQNAAVMKSLLYIFIGGGTGSVLRYLLTIAIQRQTGTAFPWGTFAVNFLGCILIGVFYTLTSRIHITNAVSLISQKDMQINQITTQYDTYRKHQHNGIKSIPIFRFISFGINGRKNR